MARIVLGLEEHDVAEEVMHFLDRTGRRAARGRAGGPLVAGLGGSGGVGATFVATHLAAALARRSVDCALVDLDVAFAGLSGPLGATLDGGPTASDLVRFGEDLGPEQVREMLWRHPEGVGGLLSPGRGDPDRGPGVYGGG